MSHRDMKEELTCPICMELFRQPRRLPCGHSYCHVCLKAMWDQCAENRGTYANYSQSLVCPECRVAVNLDYGQGIEVVPPDFKLSKLVDLFKFMKRNDSSDSSGDELHPNNQVSYPGAQPSHESGESRTAVTELPIMLLTSLPTSSSQSNQPDIAPSIVTQPPLPQQTVPPSTDTLTAVTNSQTQSNSSYPETESARATADLVPAPCPSSSSSSLMNHISNEPTAFNTRSQNNVDNVYSDVNTTSNTSQVNTINNLSDLSTSDRACNVVLPTSIQNISHSHQSSSENQLHPNLGRCYNAELPSRRDTDVDRSRSVGHYHNDNEDLDSYSGAVGGVAVNSSHRSGLSTKEEQQQVDSLGILSDWVNENHYYNQRSRNLSQSSASLPIKVTTENVQSYSEDSPERNDQCVYGDREARAQSVPTEVEERKRPVEGAGRTENIAAKGRNNVKTRKVKRGVLSRFVDSDTSSDSSGSEKRAPRRSSDKPKRWLMTRFLRSVILSESSSSDYSDDDNKNAVKYNTAKSARDSDRINPQQKHSPSVTSSPSLCPTADLNQQNNQSTSIPAAGAIRKTQKIVNRKNETNHDQISNQVPDATLERKPFVSPKSASKYQNFSNSDQRANAQDNMCEAFHPSIDSNTSPKELARQSGAGHSSMDSTRPKVIHRHQSSTNDCNYSSPSSATASFNPSAHASIPQTMSDPYSRESQDGLAAISQIEQPDSNLPTFGSPPTFYDNLDVTSRRTTAQTRYDSRGSGAKTRYDNINSHNVDTERPRSELVRDPKFNPCSQQNNPTLTSDPCQGQTFYDNVDSSQTRLRQTLPPHIQTRNQETEIEDLKLGFENVHGEYTGCDDNSGVDELRHRDLQRGELDSETRYFPQYSQDSQPESDYSFQTSPNLKSTNQSTNETYHPPTNHTVVGGDGYLSLYDNVTRLAYCDNNHKSVRALTNRANAGERREPSNGTSLAERLGHRGKSTQSNGGQHNSKHPTDTVTKSEDDLQYVDNYFDQYSENSRGNFAGYLTSPEIVTRDDDRSQRRAEGAGCTTEASREDNPSQRRAKVAGCTAGVVKLSTEVGAELSTTSDKSKQVAIDAGVNAASTNNNDESVCNTGRRTEDEEHHTLSGTAVLQNKKKPQSRLKKFFTSLLSLSSSDDDNNDGNHDIDTSSESSGW